MFAVPLFSSYLDALPITVEGTLCHPQRLIVRTCDLSFPEIRDCRIVRRFDEIGMVSVEVPFGTLSPVYARWKSWGLSVFLDRAAQPAYTPNDPMYTDSWHHPFIKSNLAWDLGFGTANPVVGIVDTGLNISHPDLIGNAWVNLDEIPDNNVDDDNNGYVDDVNGYDFAYNDPVTNDVNGHGTACAGLVAAVQDNGIGVSGVAPRAKLMGLKSALDSGYFYDTENIAAYLYAANNGADIISCSFFSDRVSDPERIALEYCVSQGVLPVVASGNSNFVLPYYPAAYECSVAVAALNGNGNKAGFSDYGSWVDVATPGTSLRTTTADGEYTNGFSGTSGACPVAAGVAAMILSRVPSLTVTQLRNVIEDTCLPVTYGSFGEYVNYGRVDAQAALQAALSGTWPGKSAVVRYMTPYSVAGAMRSKTAPSARIYGRGFQPPRSVEVQQGGRRLQIVDQQRDWVDVVLPGSLAPLEVRVNGTLVRTLPAPAENRLKYPLIEANNFDATTTGGFQEALFADGAVISTTRRGNDNIDLVATFRRVDRTKPLKLKVKRAYPGATAGTESISLYDWSTASYPYGSWVGLVSGPAVSTSTDVQTFTLTNPGRFVDDEGTVYLLIHVEAANAGLVLNLDLAELVE